MSPLLKFWLRLRLFYLVINEDGSVSHGVPDTATETFTISLPKPTWESVDERDRNQLEAEDDMSFSVYQAGIIADDGTQTLVLNFERPLNYSSLRRAVQQIAPGLVDMGYYVYELPNWR